MERVICSARENLKLCWQHSVTILLLVTHLKRTVTVALEEISSDKLQQLHEMVDILNNGVLYISKLLIINI